MAKFSMKALGGVAAVLGLLALAVPAVAQEKLHIRGTLTGVQGRDLTIQTARGPQTVKLADDAGVFIVTTGDIGAIQPNRFVGITSVEQDGKRVAREVHVFVESLRGIGEGHYPWDLESGPNMMTNANIAKVDTVGADRVLKLNYKDGEQTIAVPPDAAIVLFDKTTMDQLVAGRKVFALAQKQSDGSLVAGGIVVGAEGVKPPM